MATPLSITRVSPCFAVFVVAIIRLFLLCLAAVVCCSARPGRPPKRSSIVAPSVDALEKLKKSRLEGPDYPYPPTSLMGKWQSTTVFYFVTLIHNWQISHQHFLLFYLPLSLFPLLPPFCRILLMRIVLLVVMKSGCNLRVLLLPPQHLLLWFEAL